MRAYDMSRYRSSVEPPQSSSQQPPSSQADSYSQVPKTHRVMTLADHISVRSARKQYFLLENVIQLLNLTNLVFWSLPVMQHIITQDFARNQDPPAVSSSASATFQSVVPPVSSSGRVKVPSRYSPENQAPHHQRPSSRVSPENANDKSRARYVVPEIIGCVIITHYLSNICNPTYSGLVNLQTEEAGQWRTMNPSLHHRATRIWTNKRLVYLHPRDERLTTQRSGTTSAW